MTDVVLGNGILEDGGSGGPFPGPVVLNTLVLTLSVPTTTSVDSGDWIFGNSATNQTITVDWGDGSASSVQTAATPFRPTHTYAAGNYTATVNFTALCIAQFPTGAAGLITALDARGFGADVGSTATLAALANNVGTNIVSIALGQPSGSGTYPVMTFETGDLAYVYIRDASECSSWGFDQNVLSTASVNAILEQIQAQSVIQPNGKTLRLNGGTNGPPTGAGLTAKAALIAAGWTVVTN